MGRGSAPGKRKKKLTPRVVKDAGSCILKVPGSTMLTMLNCTLPLPFSCSYRLKILCWFKRQSQAVNILFKASPE